MPRNRRQRRSMSISGSSFKNGGGGADGGGGGGGDASPRSKALGGALVKRRSASLAGAAAAAPPTSAELAGLLQPTGTGKNTDGFEIVVTGAVNDGVGGAGFGNSFDDSESDSGGSAAESVPEGGRLSPAPLAE